MHRSLIVTQQDAFDFLAARPWRRGCDENEIQQVESELKVTFPAVYRCFLSLTGNETGWLCDWHLKTANLHSLAEIQREAVEFIRRETGQHLPLSNEVLVFASSAEDPEGFLFFRIDGASADPDVYCFSCFDEYVSSPESIGFTFGQLLIHWVKAYLKADSLEPGN